jgi:hypothetical protein
VHPSATFSDDDRDRRLGTALIGCAMFIAACIVGCGSSDGTRVSGGGQVTLDGEPVKMASISFQPKDGHGVSALTEVKNGAYSFTRENGPAAGPQRVMVEILSEDKLRDVARKEPVRGASEIRWVLEYDVPAKGAFHKDFALDGVQRGSKR